MLQLIPKVGRVPAQEERGDWADGSEIGHRNRQVSVFKIPGKRGMSAVWTVFFLLFYRTINCMVGQMKHILATEQKKTDFKPEDENNVMIQYTTVSARRALRLHTKSMTVFLTPSSSSTPPGLLKGVRLRQSAGGARAEVHGWKKRGHGADRAGRPFPPTHPRAPAAVQLQLHGRHAGHLWRGWIPTVRQGLQGEWTGLRSSIQWSQDKWLLVMCLGHLR